MATLFLKPTWLFGIDILIVLSFAIITLIVSLYSFKIYKLTNQETSRLFGLAFLFFSISYFFQSFLNFLIFFEIINSICEILKIQRILSLILFGTYVHITFLIIGLVILTYMTFKVKNKNIFALMLIISLSSLLISINTLYWFYVLSSIFLFFIASYYYSNYLKNCQTKTLLVLIAFIFLFFGHIHFIFALNHYLFYVLGHFLELLAYALILINLYLILKK